MLVFLDIKNKKVKIYTDEGSHSLNFSNSEAIAQIIGKEKVLYVTGAVQATSSDIIDVVKSMSDGDVEDEEPAFLRTTGKGYMILADIGLTLEGPSHFYPLKRLYEEQGKDVFETNKSMAWLLQTGKLQIITATEAITIGKKCSNEKKKLQSKIDAALDSIIVNGKVDEFLENYDSSGSAGDHADAISIDVKAVGSGKAMATSNEGSLLPDDFDGAGGSSSDGSSNEGSLLPDDFEG